MRKKVIPEIRSLTEFIIEIGEFFMNMKSPMFFVWIIGIAMIAFFTGEIATVMMLFLILITLNAIHLVIQDFYHDWKSRF